MERLRSRNAQQGFMLLSAVFVLLICATLSVVLVKGVEQSSASRAVNYWSTQAYLFAQSGLGVVKEVGAFCHQRDLQTQYEQALSEMFSTERQVCDLSYRCDQQAFSLEVAVSCSINKELTVSRVAIKHFLEPSLPAPAVLAN